MLFVLLFQLSKHGHLGMLVLSIRGWWSAVHYYAWGVAFAFGILISVRYGWCGVDNPITRWLGAVHTEYICCTHRLFSACRAFISRFTLKAGRIASDLPSAPL